MAVCVRGSSSYFSPVRSSLYPSLMLQRARAVFYAIYIYIAGNET